MIPMVLTDRLLSDGFFFFFLLAAALQNILAGVICHHSAAKKMSSREKRLFVHIKVSKAHTSNQCNKTGQNGQSRCSLKGFSDRIFIA